MLQLGQFFFLASQFRMQIIWNECEHEVLRLGDYERQIEHSSASNSSNSDHFRCFLSLLSMNSVSFIFFNVKSFITIILPHYKAKSSILWFQSAFQTISFNLFSFFFANHSQDKGYETSNQDWFKLFLLATKTPDYDNCKKY